MDMKAIVMNKRIILALGMMVFVAAVLISSTGAFFSDTESSTGNVFTAGAVDIAISNIAHTGPTEAGFTTGTNGFNFSFSDLKPLDTGTVTYTLNNENNPAYVCAMVDETGNNDNGTNDPEMTAGDTTPGVGGGELGNFLSFKFGTQSGTLAAISGQWQDVGSINTNATSAAAINYCFGEYDGGGSCVLNNSAVYNLAQTDSLTADVKFYAVQTRHNESFSCADLNNNVVVKNGDLSPTGWLFYNDTNDTVMTPNQFSATGGANEIAAMTGSNGAAYMKLDAGTKSPDYDGAGDAGNPRYNIATYQFKNVKLADISTIKYRTYDASASAETAYLNFNVDFNNSDTWQRRLVQIPTGITANTWTEVDAKAGMWSLSGGNWPVGVNTVVPYAGSTLRTWADIVADYPNAETRSTDSFFGIRVGHPGPVGEEGYVDWVEFNGVKYDFEI